MLNFTFNSICNLWNLLELFKSNYFGHVPELHSENQTMICYTVPYVSDIL